MSFFEGPKAKNLLGIFGDAMLGLAGQPGVYGPAMMKRRQDEEARTREWADWQKKEQWRRDNKEPDVPELAKTVNYYRSIGRNDIADDLEAKGRMVPVQQADPNTGEVRYQYVRPTKLMGGGDTSAAPATDLPRISTPAEAAKLPPGSWFIAPDGSRRKVPGGAAPSNGPGGFRRSY